jgi:oxygen-independent coproporphyrinogen-3 oxidase
MHGVRPNKPFHQFIEHGQTPEQAALSMQAEYGISTEKAKLLIQAAPFTEQVLESLDLTAVSIYVGIPFCPTRCLYCSFPSHSLEQLGKERSRFVQALTSEIAAVGKALQQLGRPVDAVYVGGGTPTALTPEDLQLVLACLRSELPAGWREFTVEAGRPETLTAAHLQVLAGQQVERISINPQTSNDRTLSAIGRQHRASDIAAAFQRSRSLIPVINMDLILGLPGEGLTDVQQSLQWVLALRPENITLHMFSPKRASRFSEEVGEWSGLLPAAAEARAMTAWCCQALASAGYNPYYLYRQRNILGGQENVGWALPGTECRYNVIMIEERQDLVGLGGGASSKFLRGGGRLVSSNNPKDVLMYIDRLPRLIEDKLQLLEQQTPGEASQ